MSETPGPVTHKVKFSWLKLTFLVLGLICFALVLVGFLVRSNVRPRAIQAEAKVNLGFVFSCEKSIEFELHHYSLDLINIGFSPQGDLRYAIGFSSNCRHGTEVTNTIEAMEKGAQFHHAFSAEIAEKISKYFKSLPCPAHFPEEFETWAVGDIGGSQFDIWKINDKRELVHIQEGSP